MSEVISVHGARTHNLQNIDVAIPRNRLVVITGVSGSGKSSLAFDTLLAEGRRQYIESLSVYARQFFDQVERPDVDRIEGLQPTIAIEQREAATNPRSTVATLTEIYGYLRVLMARCGDVACPQCGTPIAQQTPAEIEAAIRALPPQSRVMILAPVIRGRKGSHPEAFEEIRKAGFVRVRVDGEPFTLEDVPELTPQKPHDIEAVVDRIVVREGIETRLAESVRLAVKHGDGVVRVSYQTPAAKSHRQQAGSSGQQAARGGSAAKEPAGWEERLFNTRYACPDCQSGIPEIEPRTFSFNSPYGACPACGGLGASEGFDPELVLPDLSLSLHNGAIAPWGRAAADRGRLRLLLSEFVESAGVDWDKPLQEWPPAARQRLLAGDKDRFPGVLAHLEMDFAAADSPAARRELAAYRGRVTCAECGGTRLRPEARACRLSGRAIFEITALSVGDAREFFQSVRLADAQLHEQVATPLLREILRRLAFLDSVGADYLSLDRPADTLSGGEMQRVRLAACLASGLVGVLYVLDEPSIGLHPRDNERLIATIRDLQQQGNTVIVVEHDEMVMREADHIIDCGPGAGALGGHVVAEGSFDEICRSPESLTGRYLSGEQQIPLPETRRPRAKTRSLRLIGATLNNLDDVTLELPLGLLVCVTGVSGSGKSSLLVDTLAKALARRLHGAEAKAGPYKSLAGVSQIERLVQVDQSPIGRSPRSNAATYTGAFDEIRRIFAATRLARQRGYKGKRFSFNAPGGRCEDCQGQGAKKIEMKFLPDLFVPCPTCHGAQFNRQTLAVRYRGQSIADVLAMSVADAAVFFDSHPTLHRLLKSLEQVGLGYLALGQPSNTLSGGEAQRIKLATELGRPPAGPTLYILDEPTTGLHFEDVRRQLAVLGQLVDQGNSVVVIEHHLDVMKSADWIIDLGPEGGAAGGRIIAAGTPEEVARCEASHTGRYLRGLFV